MGDLVAKAREIAKLILDGIGALWDGIKWTVEKIKEFFGSVISSIGKLHEYLRDTVLPTVEGRCKIEELKTLREFEKNLDEMKAKLPEIQRIMEKYAKEPAATTNESIRATLTPLKDFAEGTRALA